jgi:hypothetical protein
LVSEDDYLEVRIRCGLPFADCGATLRINWNDPVKARLILLVLAACALVVGITQFKPRGGPKLESPRPVPSNVAANSADEAPAVSSEAVPLPQPKATSFRSAPAFRTAPEPTLATNRLERLNQLREQFRALAAGDPRAAMATAKQLTNEVERETALLTLVTQWTNGELSSPGQRAQSIAALGLEAGLGIELAKHPELAVVWANELTEGLGRSALLERVLLPLLGSDPAAAFALGAQLSPGEQREFLDSLYATWASNDTDAALQWAQQSSDPVERDAALRAIHTTAPVGIGAAVAVQDGYPVINGLLPGTPAELGGQLHKGDRILALAQGDDAFVYTQGMALADVVQMIRGAPGSTLQLQIVPADAPVGSPPQTISILRDQIKFKR